MIIVKAERKSDKASDKDIKFEVFESYILYSLCNKTQLNLALCDKYPINLLIPLELNDEMKQQYEQLKKSGYNILDINDDFYQDICIPFDSSEGTDMIISD